MYVYVRVCTYVCMRVYVCVQMHACTQFICVGLHLGDDSRGTKRFYVRRYGLKICVCTVVVIVCLRILLIIKIYGNGSLSGGVPLVPP